MHDSIFQVYCKDKYKNGDLIQQTQYKYLCPCNTKEQYLEIREDYIREKRNAKNILATERQEKERKHNIETQNIFRTIIVNYSTLSNNRMFKRQTKTQDYNIFLDYIKKKL
jgi:hypothetical protein